MAEKFHINSKGEPGRCSAEHGGCPFGTEGDHYVTKEGASAAYERSMSDGTIPTLTKAPTREQVEQVLDSMARGEDTIPEGIEFVESKTESDLTKPELPERGLILQAEVQEEIEWTSKALEEARADLNSAAKFSDHIEKNFGAESEAYENAVDSQRWAYYKVTKIKEYRANLETERDRLEEYGHVISYPDEDFRETTREKRLKKELDNLQYEPKDGTPGLKELEDRLWRPIRGNESRAAYGEYLLEAGSPKNSTDRNLMIEKQEVKRSLQLQIDEEAAKRQARETPEQTNKREAEEEKTFNETVALLKQDKENFKTYNSFANRALRMFSGKKKIAAARSELNALPLGRSVIDYGDSGKDAAVWMKIGDNRWQSDRGYFSTNDQRKLPATLVE